jgi:glycosyltransferase involved in cell wall biosynthesis
VIATIHDVIPLILPEYGGSLPMRLYLRLISAAARKATVILTDSECSRQDIARVLGIPHERIRVIQLGVEERFRPDPHSPLAPELRARFGLAGPVIFNGPGLDVRKNVVGLIDAFARALPRLDPATKLIIAGRGHTGNTQLYPPLAPFIERAGIERNVVLTGAISEEEKLAFYQLADLYVFPSRYEGFGLPPLEAMACGTPVIAANTSSLPEVVGNGGVLVAPEPEPLAEAIVTVMRDPGLRAELARRGPEQAASFSWRRTAAETRAVYREVLAGTPRR